MRAPYRTVGVEVARQRATGALPKVIVVAIVVAIASTVVDLTGLDAHPAPAIGAGDVVVNAPPAPSAGARVAHDALRSTTVWMTIALVAFGLGTIVTAGERSAGTLARSLLVQPRRPRFVLEKLASASVLSAVGAVVLGGASWVLASAWLSSVDASTATSTATRAADLGAGVVAVACFAGIGAAVGLVSPSPYAAGAVGLVAVVAESALASRAPDVATYLPGHLLEAVSHSGVSLWSEPGVGQATALGVLLAWVAGTTAISGAVFVRRDVP